MTAVGDTMCPHKATEGDMGQPSLRQNGGVSEPEGLFQELMSQLWVDTGLEHLRSSSSGL